MKIEDKYISIPEKEERSAEVITSLNKKLLVVTPDMSSDQESRKTLMAIISAMKLNAKADVNYIFVKNDKSIYSQDLIEDVKMIILFGVDPEVLNLNINVIKYQLLKFEKFKLIMSDNMDTLNKNKNLKLNLWNIIKDITL